MFFQFSLLDRRRLRRTAAASLFGAAAIVTSLTLQATPASAACVPDPATSGKTVTCSGLVPGGFDAGAVNNLTVNVLPGTLIGDNGVASITVNDSNTVTSAGTLAPAAFLTGISAGSFNTITNNSIITAADGIGISALNSNTIVNNSLINVTGGFGGGIAIAVGDNNTITNNSILITSDGGSGIAGGSNNTILNAAGASITGGSSQGVFLIGDNNKVTNAGLITVGDTICFCGTATGISAFGDDNKISNLAGATISAGQGAVGIDVLGNRAAVDNAGTITASHGSGGISVQGDDAKVTNSGSITVGNNFAAGIAVAGNNALITNTATGNITVGSLLSEGIVVFGDGNTIINNGKINVGNNFGAGIDVNSSPFGSNTVINTGTITVGTGGIGIFVVGTVNIFNSGKIDAAAGTFAIQFCGCGFGNVLTLGPGSNIIGLVQATGTDTFQLGGIGKDTFDLSKIGPGQQYDGFNTFNKVDSSNWTVIGTGNQDWNVLGGTLSVNGTINGVVTVAAGATLGGTGTVGDAIIDGTLAPGNSIGVFNIAGNLVMTAAASYLIEVSGANSDLTKVAGTATLGGATVVVTPTGSVVKQYLILNATGGVVDTFNPNVVVSVPNLKGTLTYDPNSVYLNFALNYGPGLNINQQNVATTLVNAFNSTGTIPIAFAALSPAGLTQVSGELATGSQQATFDSMNLFLGLITDPFVAGRNGGMIGNAGATPFADERGSVHGAFAKMHTKADVARNDLLDTRWSVWGSAFGGGSNTNGNTVVGSNEAKARAFGFAVGADYRLSPQTLVGFAIAGGGTNFSVLNAGSGRSDMFQAGVFLRHNQGPAYVTAGATFGWQDVTTDRTVTAAGFEQLRANFNATSAAARIEGGYRFATGFMGITPYAAGQFISYFLPSYSEQVIAGPGVFALNYAGKDVTASRTELGVRLDKSYAMESAILTLRGRLAWAHDFNTDRSILPAFQTLAGAAPFTVFGAAQAPNSALVTAAAEMKWLNGWSVAGIFEGQFSDINRTYSGKGVLRYSW